MSRLTGGCHGHKCGDCGCDALVRGELENIETKIQTVNGQLDMAESLRDLRQGLMVLGGEYIPATIPDTDVAGLDIMRQLAQHRDRIMGGWCIEE